MGKAVGGNAVIERRIAAAQGLRGADGHAVAGFVDAEGCFQITPNNQGRAWSCRMSVAVRLDDADTVTDLCRVTGVGRVTTKHAQATSRPQACWNVASKRECAHLAQILREFPLRARKRRDFEIWARAVDRWAASPYDAKASCAATACSSCAWARCSSTPRRAPTTPRATAPPRPPESVSWRPDDVESCHRTPPMTFV
jgi:hypothetical protein